MKGFSKPTLRKIVTRWREEGGDKASLVSLFATVLMLCFLVTIPQLAVIGLLLLGFVPLATAILMTLWTFRTVMYVWSAKRLVDNVKEVQREHQWRATRGDEAHEEQSICDVCGRYASEAALTCIDWDADEAA